ncbi:MAG: urease accessory protein, partial [Verrucomicrobiota bacterium]
TNKFLPLLGVRAGISSKSEPAISDFILWQIIDSAFPTGGFAHSVGLEAAWQHGEVRNRDELTSFVEASLNQLGRAALPFVTAAYTEPERLDDFDQLCDAFTTNHVANRASRAQGKAFLTAVERIFVGVHALACSESTLKRGLQPSHFAPCFGACLRRLEVPRDTAMRLFFFNHLRAMLAAAVRLNIVGPMEAQRLQYRFACRAEEILKKCGSLTLEEIAQTAPLLELWQGAQDRLYSRLFQS